MNERESEILEKYPFRGGADEPGAGRVPLRDGGWGAAASGDGQYGEAPAMGESDSSCSSRRNHRIRVETYVENVDGAIRTESSDRGPTA